MIYELSQRQNIRANEDIRTAIRKTNGRHISATADSGITIARFLATVIDNSTTDCDCVSSPSNMTSLLQALNDKRKRSDDDHGSQDR